MSLAIELPAVVDPLLLGECIKHGVANCTVGEEEVQGCNKKLVHRAIESQASGTYKYRSLFLILSDSNFMYQSYVVT